MEILTAFQKFYAQSVKYLLAFSLPGGLPPRMTNMSRHEVDTGGISIQNDCSIGGRSSCPLKIRGILTPACALAQNDRLVTTSSELPPRMIE